jgi:hypothetical protein
LYGTRTSGGPHYHLSANGKPLLTLSSKFSQRSQCPRSSQIANNSFGGAVKSGDAVYRYKCSKILNDVMRDYQPI